MNAIDDLKVKNPESDILAIDLHDPAKVNALDWEGLDKTEVIRQLKALQRVQRVVADPLHARALLDAGFDSAHKITSVSKQEFADQMGAALGSDGEQLAAKMYETAGQRTNQAMHAWGLVNHLSAQYFQALPANAIHPDVNEYFKGMPGYQDFFGSLNYCDCSECKSIFGPAAYFVDLLRIIDKRVTQVNVTKATGKSTIPPSMSFDERRPDLKNIKLTCENTNRMIPYINIVNERLEGVLVEPSDDPGTLPKRVSDLYQKIAQLDFPFNLPFHLPLTSIRAILARLKTSLGDILRLLGAPADGNGSSNKFPFGTVTISENPTDGDTLTIAGTVITFTSQEASQNQVKIGVNPIDTANALYLALSHSETLKPQSQFIRFTVQNCALASQNGER